MKKILVLLCIVSMSGPAFSAGAKEETKNYNFGGSTTVEPIILTAIEAFQKSNPGVTISYEGQGSSVGITGVIDGVYTLGGSSREVKDSELEKGIVPVPIALDGIAVIANSNINIANLSLEQVAKIFTGEITNWKDVNGPDAAIVMINRDEASGTRATFLELVLDVVYGKGKAGFLANAVTVESNGDMVTKVGSTPNAIGYCGFGYIDQAKSSGGKAIAVNGVDPLVSRVVDGTYAISRKLFVVYKNELKAGSVEKKFLDYLLSKDGQAIVKEEKFIPLP